jgi:hypothetical protein
MPGLIRRPSRATPMASSVLVVPLFVNLALEGILVERALSVSQLAVSASDTLVTAVLVVEVAQLNLTLKSISRASGVSLPA